MDEGIPFRKVREVSDFNYYTSPLPTNAAGGTAVVAKGALLGAGLVTVSLPEQTAAFVKASEENDRCLKQRDSGTDSVLGIKAAWQDRRAKGYHMQRQREPISSSKC